MISDLTLVQNVLNMLVLITDQGSSVSAFWYSLFDNGTNYCNLHNGIQGTFSHTLTGFILTLILSIMFLIRKENLPHKENPVRIQTYDV